MYTSNFQGNQTKITQNERKLTGKMVSDSVNGTHVTRTKTGTNWRSKAKNRLSIETTIGNTKKIADGKRRNCGYCIVLAKKKNERKKSAQDNANTLTFRILRIVISNIIRLIITASFTSFSCVWWRIGLEKKWQEKRNFLTSLYENRR